MRQPPRMDRKPREDPSSGYLELIRRTLIHTSPIGRPVRTATPSRHPGLRACMA